MQSSPGWNQMQPCGEAAFGCKAMWTLHTESIIMEGYLFATLLLFVCNTSNKLNYVCRTPRELEKDEVSSFVEVSSWMER